MNQPVNFEFALEAPPADRIKANTAAETEKIGQGYQIGAGDYVSLNTGRN